MKPFRQGDVLIIPVRSTPKLGAKIGRDRGRIVLAYGEVTGHAHAIKDRDADLFEIEGLDDRFLRVLHEGGVNLDHEEHATITLPARKRGGYIVRTQREYTPEAIVRVAD